MSAERKPRAWLATRIRRLADRLDHAGAPKRVLPYSFTFERGKGIQLRADGLGCPLWYVGDEDYRKAHTEGSG